MSNATGTSAFRLSCANGFLPCDDEVAPGWPVVRAPRAGEGVDPVGLLRDLFVAWSNLSREPKTR